jgi:hypothetical protein
MAVLREAIEAGVKAHGAGMILPSEMPVEEPTYYESLRMSPCRVRLKVPGRLAAALKFCRGRLGSMPLGNSKRRETGRKSHIPIMRLLVPPTLW